MYSYTIPSNSNSFEIKVVSIIIIIKLILIVENLDNQNI